MFNVKLLTPTVGEGEALVLQHTPDAEILPRLNPEILYAPDVAVVDVIDVAAVVVNPNVVNTTLAP